MILDMQQYNENKHAKQYNRVFSCQINGTIKNGKLYVTSGGKLEICIDLTRRNGNKNFFFFVL